MAASWRAQVRLIPDRVHAALEQTERHGLRILVPGEPEWPVEVDQLGARTPVVLWTKGPSKSLADPEVARIAVVGARAATRYGYDVATDLAAGLAQTGIHIVSGGAYGIDAAAHRAALLDGATTIAVMPGGLDRLYPAGNHDLLERVGKSGLLVRELPPGATPTRWRLQQRTRLIAALSDGVLVVEAGHRSGALEVVRQAHELHRPVGAVPGPITSASSAETNLLIQDRQAMLVTSADDVRRLLLPGPARLDRERQLDAPDPTAISVSRSTPGGFYH